MKALIVTADDFGLAPQVNEAVERAHTDGVLTTASLMVGAPVVDQAVAIARRNPGLRVGLHLVLVEGRPLLPLDQVRRLIARSGRGEGDVHSVHSVHHDSGVHSGAEGREAQAHDLHDLHGADVTFRTDMARAGVDYFFLPSARRQLAAEIEAQFAAYAATGLPLDHLTTHKHFHLHPTIAGMILKIGKRYGLRAARTPLEPAAPLAAAEPGYRPPAAWVTAPWARLVQARFHAAGVFTPDRVFGLRWSGAMTRARVAGLVRNLPPGVTELYTHPATAPGFPGEAPGYAYAEELAALTSPEVRQAVERSGARLGGFSDFAPTPSTAHSRERGNPGLFTAAPSLTSKSGPPHARG